MANTDNTYMWPLREGEREHTQMCNTNPVFAFSHSFTQGQVYFLSSSLLLMARAGSLFWDGLGQLNYSISKCFHYSCQPISCRRMGPYETMWLRLGLLCVYWEVYFTAMCVCNHKLILRQGKRRIRGTRLVKKDLIPSNLPATISWLHRYLPPTWDSCNTTSPCVAIHEN